MIKNKILNIINKEVTKRSRVSVIKNDVNLWSWVLYKSNHIYNISDSERLYFTLYGKNKKCLFDKTNIKYVSFSVGYKFCGPANKCKCALESVKKKVKLTKLKYTDIQRSKILKKRIKTLNCLYGVNNVFQIDDIKKKSKLTMIKNYNVCNPRQSQFINNKIKETCLERYGVDNPLKSDKIKEKIKNTCLERYGVDSSVKSKIIQKRAKQTNLIRYGVENPLKSEIIRKKIKQTTLERYGVENLFLLPQVQEKIRNNQKKTFYSNLKDRTNNTVSPNFDITNYIGVQEIYSWSCITCGNKFEDHLRNGRIPVCRKCYPLSKSVGEQEVKEYIKKLNINIFENDRQLIKPYELDIVIPEKKIAIEYNGLYWHSESRGKDSHYHKNKFDMCQKQDYQLITIFEDEWVHKQDICKAILQHILGVNNSICYVKQPIIKEISNNEYKDFVNRYHIQGFIGATIKLGAYYKDELVAVMGFHNKEKNYKLLRFCSKGSIPGVGSKLFKHFTRNYNPNEIISYCDLRWETGVFYEKLGFKLSHISRPNYWYFKNQKMRHHKYKFCKTALSKMKSYLKDKTKQEIMAEEGYYRIWDCGNKVFKWKKDNS